MTMEVKERSEEQVTVAAHAARHISGSACVQTRRINALCEGGATNIAAPASLSTNTFECKVRTTFDINDDIDDILASISTPKVARQTLDLQALTRAWINERTAPELLPYPTSLIKSVMDRLKV